jgi:anti-sigma factor RsiW
MKVEWVGQHPDEGSIHAWLDGELDPSDAELLAEHVRGCSECGARAAEARGLMAGASRVVRQLDVTPARLIQPASTPTLDDSGSMWRLMRVTPARASIAAILLVALGITLTRSRVATDSEVVPTVATAPVSGEAMTAMAAPKEAQAPIKDRLLDSAIGRRLAEEHPARTLKPAPGAAIPSPDVPVRADAVPDLTAPQRVAVAREAIRARADTVSPPADKARVGFRAGAPTALDRVTNAAQAAEVAGARNDVSLSKVVGAIGLSTSGQCYLVESSAPGAQWGTATLPIVLAFDSTGTTARVLTPNGADTEMRAVRTAARTDSLVLRLRRIGYEGSLALDAIGDARGGVMRSNAATSSLESVVVTGAEQRIAARSDTRVPQPAAAPPAVAKRAEAPARERDAAAATKITAHVVSCATRR